MRNLLRPLLRVLTLLFPRMWRIEGAERRTGKKMSVICCGPELHQAYILSRIFGDEGFERRYVGRRPVFLLKRIQRKFDCPLGVAAAPRWLLSLIRGPGDIEVPSWLEAEVEIDIALNPAGQANSLKDDFRRIRKNGLEFRCVSDFESYRRFYEDYYLPTVTGSHGAAALPADFNARWQKISSGNAELIWVMRNGEPVSGMVVSYDGRVPYLRDIGIRSGDRALLKTGAATAAYYFSLQRLRERGYEKVSLGTCRPFLDDGVLNFKKKWHPKLSDTNEQPFLIRVTSLCDGARGFLRESSYIGENAGELRFTLIAANDDDFRAGEPALERLSSIYGIDGRSYVDVSGQRPKFRKVS